MCLGLITICSAACFLDIWGIHDSGALASLIFGGESDYINKDDYKGSSFDVGAVVEYQGRQCKVSQAVDDDGDIEAKFPAATLETSMTEADISGLKLGAAGAIIAAAFLPKW